MDRQNLTQAREWGLLKDLVGKTFCFTGTMSLKRDDLTWLIVMLGGNVQSSVTVTTDYLLIPDGTVRKGSKYQAAVRHGTKIINEEEFCDMIFPSLDELLVSN